MGQSRKNFGALLKNIIGNYKSMIGPGLVRPEPIMLLSIRLIDNIGNISNIVYKFVWINRMFTVIRKELL